MTSLNGPSSSLDSSPGPWLIFGVVEAWVVRVLIQAPPPLVKVRPGEGASTPTVCLLPAILHLYPGSSLRKEKLQDAKTGTAPPESANAPPG